MRGISQWFSPRPRRHAHAGGFSAIALKRCGVISPMRLVVEIDGGQHADAKHYDQKRDTYLQSRGFRVLRFWNADVLTNMEGAIDTVLIVLNGETGSPSP